MQQTCASPRVHHSPYTAHNDAVHSETHARGIKFPHLPESGEPVLLLSTVFRDKQVNSDHGHRDQQQQLVPADRGMRYP